jgi:hypothetical protein
MRLLPSRPIRALIVAASLAVCGCANHGYLRSLTYEYTDQRRLAAERRATQDMQDSCYFSGFQYFRPEGPPQVVSVSGPAGPQFQATQTFSCVGTNGGGF